MSRADRRLRSTLAGRALLCVLLAGAAAPAFAVTVLTGEVQATDAQSIIVPQSNSSPVVLRYFVPEGQRVKKGQVVLRIDPGESSAQIRELDTQIEQAQAKMEKELAELQVKEVDAELALADADAALATARVDAGLPADVISRLEYDRHQGELDSTTRQQALKRKELGAASEAVQRRRHDGQLEVDKLRIQRDYHAKRVAAAEVRAEAEGVVVHGFSRGWLGDGRIDEGASAMPGSKAGEVVRGGAMRVRAWALEPDRRGLRVGQPVQLVFDALPGKRLSGRIATIGGAPEAREEWGNGRYFVVDITLPAAHGLRLLPGMNVRVEAAGVPAKSRGAGVAK